MSKHWGPIRRAALGLYKRGYEARRIAELLDISSCTVWSWVRQAGIKKHRERLSDKELSLLKTLHKQGLSAAAIGCILARHPSTVVYHTNRLPDPPGSHAEEKESPQEERGPNIRQRLCSERTTAIIRGHKEGESVHSLAQRFDVTTFTIHRALNTRSGRDRQSWKLTRADVERLIELYKAGMSQTKIAEEFNISRAAVRYHIVKNKKWDHGQGVDDRTP